MTNQKITKLSKIAIDENEYQEIEISLIDMSQSKMRNFVEDDEFEELVNSISIVGLINPITVHREVGIYKLIAGQRRLMACRKLGRDKITARVIHANLKHYLLVQYHENVSRQSVSLLDEGKYLYRVKELLQYNNHQLANYINKSESYVTKRIALKSMLKIIQEAVADGKITLNNAMFINKLTTVSNIQFVIGYLQHTRLKDVDLKNFCDQLNETEDKNNVENNGSPEKETFVSSSYLVPKAKCDICEMLVDLVELKLVRVCKNCIIEDNVNNEVAL